MRPRMRHSRFKDTALTVEHRPCRTISHITVLEARACQFTWLRPLKTIKHNISGTLKVPPPQGQGYVAPYNLVPPRKSELSWFTSSSHFAFLLIRLNAALFFFDVTRVSPFQLLSNLTDNIVESQAPPTIPPPSNLAAAPQYGFSPQVPQAYYQQPGYSQVQYNASSSFYAPQSYNAPQNYNAPQHYNSTQNYITSQYHNSPQDCSNTQSTGLVPSYNNTQSMGLVSSYNSTPGIRSIPSYDGVKKHYDSHDDNHSQDYHKTQDDVDSQVYGDSQSNCTQGKLVILKDIPDID